MPEQLVECVPNFSEGRDRTKFERIRDSIAGVPGVILLRSEMDPDHNRSVMTFAGPPDAVFEAAFQGVRAAVELIDLAAHRGVHPRIGAADVVPFVPVDGVSLQDCVEIAHRFGAKVWTELGVPVYFYEAAARESGRARLENVRRGGFENAALPPDLGGPLLHPRAGACIVGARKFLIAYNINLATPDVGIAKAIANKIRTSSGGLPHVKALGLHLSSRNLAQVSINLTDYEQTPLHVVFERVREEAAALGVRIAGSELIGLIPKRALEAAAAHFLAIENFQSGHVFENRLHDLQANSVLPSHLSSDA